MKIKLFIAILIINFLNIGHVKAVFDIEAKTAILQDYLSGEIERVDHLLDRKFG